MIAEFLASYITGWISWGGYPVVFILMALESMVAPVPSEAVMPFTGFLVYEGGMNWGLIILVSTLGSITGSLISYYAGAYGGKPFIQKFGKYFFLDLHDLEFTEKFFNKYGGATIFVSRFIPVVRHLISIPAGIGRMNILRFSIYTILGAAIWNAFLMYAGYYLRSRWDEIMKYAQTLDIIIIAALILIIAVFFYKHYKNRQ